ncbi:conserved protein of unknown function (plasmid) [Cupriavidus taiwanensis]|uniref:Uncharacterized protein n=1 Tax=Cupriavidus taiwanensis TaxID=164546 RepID=A0A9Q7XUL9_9BURK|nr:hypothetical protein [Cupriavidus taiwanensis]SPD67960.1 conserved protein of unknown function [Cupriavidus taiwanensis]
MPLATTEISPLLDSNANYYLWRDGAPEDNRLFIVFSSRGARPGVFSFYNTFQKLGVNVLHVTPPDYTWYQSGLIGLGTNATTAMLALGEIVSKVCITRDIREIILVGASMGGYGALLYGLLNKHDCPVRVIAFSAETLLLLPNSRSSEAPFHVPEDLRDLRDADYSHLDASILFGEFDLIDSYCALSIVKRPGISLISLTSATHMIPEALNKSIGIVDFFKTFLNGGRYVPGQGHMQYALESTDMQPLITAPQFSEEYLTSLKHCLRKYPNFGFGWNRLGVYLRNRNRLDEAHYALNRSKAINPTFQNTLEHLQAVSKAIKRS